MCVDRYQRMFQELPGCHQIVNDPISEFGQRAEDVGLRDKIAIP
jgi:hypothetical protein